MQKLLIVAILGGATLFTFPQAASARTSKSFADQKCKPGTQNDGAGSEWSGGLNPKIGSLTPNRVPGAARVTPAEIMCLFREYDRELKFVTPITDHKLIAGSYRVAGGGNPGSFDDAAQRRVAEGLQQITGNDKNMPLVIYCHSPTCFLSYNMVLRASYAGYRNLYWFRTGIAGWRSAGGPMVDGDINEAKVRREAADNDARDLVAAEDRRERESRELLERSYVNGYEYCVATDLGKGVRYISSLLAGARGPDLSGEELARWNVGHVTGEETARRFLTYVGQRFEISDRSNVSCRFGPSRPLLDRTRATEVRSRDGAYADMNVVEVVFR